MNMYMGTVPLADAGDLFTAPLSSALHTAANHMLKLPFQNAFTMIICIRSYMTAQNVFSLGRKN